MFFFKFWEFYKNVVDGDLIDFKVWVNSVMINLKWNFKPSYQSLPRVFFSHVSPEPVQKPELILINHDLAADLNLDLPAHLSKSDAHNLAHALSGNVLPQSSDPIALAYAGHQFGHFTVLGDGRAHVLGEHITAEGGRFDIQFKGSGQTPYSRGGDGRAALAPMLREYIISEAMHALNIPTTRSLAVVSTGETVYRETGLPGAILTRVASSHLRVGTFEFARMQADPECLKRLLQYSIDRHAPHLKESQNPALDFLNHVMQKQCALIVDWMRVGFVHGVMNTDNMSISGETIDYGPCAFMDMYDEKTVFSSIDRHGRYAYGNQPHMAQWNLACLAEALLPLLDKNKQTAIELAKNQINAFANVFASNWLNMMRQKLGLLNEDENDQALIHQLLMWMQNHQVDYTYTFYCLSQDMLPSSDSAFDQVYASVEFQQWHANWQKRLKQQVHTWHEVQTVMQKHNPSIIPRNVWVEEALQNMQHNSDPKALMSLLDQLKQPYNYMSLPQTMVNPPPEQEYKTYCGT